MENNNIFNIDLNSLLSESVLSDIKSLEDTIKELNNTLLEYHIENEALKKENEKYKTLLNYTNIFNDLKESYNKINLSWDKFLFISNMMKTFYDIDYKIDDNQLKETKLNILVSVVYHKNKKELINILNILEIPTEYVKNFVMPFDYSRDIILNYASSSFCNVNGEYINYKYWLDSGANIKNVPHTLLFQNEYFLDDEIFKKVLKSFKLFSEAHRYFNLDLYNKNITDEHISKLGERILDIKGYTSYDNIRVFINRNLRKFNNKTLDFLLKDATHDNSYKVLHYEKFPLEYQIKYLMNIGDYNLFISLLSENDEFTNEEKINLTKRYIDGTRC